MKLRLRVFMAALVCTFGLATSAQAAESMTVRFGADPTEEIRLPVTMSWGSAHSPVFVAVTVKPAGPLGCGATWAIDAPNSDNVMLRTGGYSGVYTRYWSFADPGARTLCGYLQRSAGDPSPLAVTGPINVPVRAARATVAVSVPARLSPSQPFPLTVTAATELRRYVVVTNKPAGAGGCAASHSLDDPISRDIFVARQLGAQRWVKPLTAPSVLGNYVLCAYVEENSADQAPEAVASASYAVAPDPCVTAKAALVTAARAAKRAERVVRRTRTAYHRAARRARHAAGAERRRLRHRAARAKRRYRAAVRRRDQARAALTAAQTNVDAACGTGA